MIGYLYNPIDIMDPTNPAKGPIIADAARQAIRSALLAAASWDSGPYSANPIRGGFTYCIQLGAPCAPAPALDDSYQSVDWAYFLGTNGNWTLYRSIDQRACPFGSYRGEAFLY